jgi:hypothetical protein
MEGICKWREKVKELYNIGKKQKRSQPRLGVDWTADGGRGRWTVDCGCGRACSGSAIGVCDVRSGVGDRRQLVVDRWQLAAGGKGTRTQKRGTCHPSSLSARVLHAWVQRRVGVLGLVASSPAKSQRPRKCATWDGMGGHIAGGGRG